MSNKIIFERSSLSQIKGFKDLNAFDDFIQSSLDKFYFTEVIPKLDETAEKFHDYIINDESLRPDLIIYNKTFNKNNCYYDYYDYGFNKYPRKKFTLKADNNKSKNNDDTIKDNNEENKENKNENTNENKEMEIKKEEEIKESEMKEEQEEDNNNKKLSEEIINNNKDKQNDKDNDVENQKSEKKEENKKKE